MAEPVHVTITDDFGDEHEYNITPWKPGHGLKLSRKLAGLLAPLGIRLLGSATATATGLGASDESKLASDEDEDDEGGFDGEAAAVAVERFVAELINLGDEQLFHDILKNTARDGKSVARGMGFDQAYQANYGELFMAVFETLKANFAPFSRRFAGSAGLMLAKGGLLGSALDKIGVSLAE